MSLPPPQSLTDLPPPGASWDVPLCSARLVFFDLELTGNDPTYDDPVEVAVVCECNGEVTEEFSTLVRAERAVSAAAAAVHQIPPESLLEAPDFAEVAPRLASLCEGAVLVGHHPVLDLPALERGFARAGLAAPSFAHVLDTMVLARRAVSARTYALGALCRGLSLEPLPTHRALPDARATRALFWRLARELDARDARDLWEVRVGQRGSVLVRSRIDAALRAHERAKDLACLWVRRPGEGVRALRGRVEKYEPPYLWLSGPSGYWRALRADRILRMGEGRPTPTRTA